MESNSGKCYPLPSCPSPFRFPSPFGRVVLSGKSDSWISYGYSIFLLIFGGAVEDLSMYWALSMVLLIDTWLIRQFMAK